MLFLVNRSRVTSSSPLTCGPAAACAPATAARARVMRASATLRVGLPASARSTRPFNAGSSKPRHQSAASSGVFARESRPALSGAIVCATDAIPALLAQPPRTRSAADARAAAIIARIERSPRAAGSRDSVPPPAQQSAYCRKSFMASTLFAQRVARLDHALEVCLEGVPFDLGKAGEMGVHDFREHRGHLGH